MKNKVLLIFSLIFVTSNIVSAQTAKRIITNADLEKYKIAREKAEADYRANYKKLGMPSPEELEQRERESQKQREELAQKIALERQQNAGYFQAQANDLKNQIINVDAQINYLQNQIGTIPLNQNRQIFYSTGVPYGNYNSQVYGQSVHAPGVQINTNNTRLNTNNVRIVTTPPVRNAPNFPPPRRNYGRNYYGGGYYILPNTINNNSYGRDELVSRLQYLQQVRAGLIAQWNQLSDDARRAGTRID